jgi:hypothetical protein
MGGKDHNFAWLGHRLQLFARDPVEHLFRYPPGPVEPIDLSLFHIGALPGPAGVSCQVHAGSLARAAGCLALPGIIIRCVGFFIHPGQLFLEPAGLLGHRWLRPQGDLGRSAKLGSAGRKPAGFFGRHIFLSVEAKYKQISPNLALREDLRKREKTKRKRR